MKAQKSFKLESTKIIKERKLVGSEASMVELCEQVIDFNYYYIHKKTWKTQKLVCIMQNILESASFVPSTENYEYPREIKKPKALIVYKRSLQKQDSM